MFCSRFRRTSGLYGSLTLRSRLPWLPWVFENDPWRLSGVGVAGSVVRFGRYVWNVGRFWAASIIDPVGLEIGLTLML